MILILALWLIVIGYTLVYLGLDKLSPNRQGYSFFQVFFPQFLGAKVTSDGSIPPGGGGAGLFRATTKAVGS